MRGSRNAKSPFCSFWSFFNTKNKGRKRRGLRAFELLEDRLALSVVTPSVTSLPDEVTIYAGSSFHYTTEEDTNFEVVDLGNLSGMEAVQLSGRTVSITYDVTDAETNQTRELGSIVIQLFDSDAVNSANRFYQLANSSGQNFYEGKEVTRIASVYSIIQAGSPNGDLTGGSSLDPIVSERSWKLSQNSAGMVMFCGGSGGVSDQFYIAWDTCAEFDYDYNVLGFVVSGYDTLDALSKLETKDRDMSSGKEKSDPVDKIVMKNVTVSQSPASNVFRLCAAAGTSGTTQVVLNVTGENGEVVQKTVTVNVVDLEAAENGDKIELEMTAGETLRVNLPSKFGDLNGKPHLYSAAAYKSDATASTADKKLPKGVTLTNDKSNTYFELAADSSSSGVFEIALTVAELDSSEKVSGTKTVYYDVYVRPGAPSVEFSEEYLTGTSTTATTSTTLQYVISNIANAADLYVTIQKDDGQLHEYQLTGGQTDYSDYYTRKKVGNLYEYTLTLTPADLRNQKWGVLGESDSVDGLYRVTAWQELDVEYNEHESLVSDSTESLITVVLSAPLEIEVDKTFFTLGPGGGIVVDEPIEPIILNADSGLPNIAASIRFAEGALVPANMTITQKENGEYQLEWTPTSNDKGHEYHVPVVKIDSIGREVSETLVFRVSNGPSFNVFDAEENSVAGQTVNIDEATSVSFTVDLKTGQDEYDPQREYVISYNLYKITTVDGEESKELVASDSLSLENGIASWDRSFSESDGPGTFRVEFVAARDGQDEPETKITVGIQVAELNAGPTITFQQAEPFRVEVGSSQEWKLTATDPDVPVQSLVWSIEGTAPACVTLAADGSLTFTPTRDDSNTEFTVKVIVSDGLATASMDLSFVVPLWVEPGDNADVVVPEALPTITTSKDCITAWGNVNAYRLEQIQASKDRFLTAFTKAADTLKETVSELATQLQAGSITREEYQLQCREAVVAKEQEQTRNAANLESRTTKINEYSQQQYDAIASTGSTLGLAFSPEDAINENEPIRLSYSEMQRIWQASLPCFASLSSAAVDAILASYLS